MPETPPEIVPETKDWTWVLAQACPECGLEAATLRLEDVPELLRESALLFGDALAAGPLVGVRPDPATWSVLEYACHVRDVHRIFAERLRLILDSDVPTFENWDQDRTAVADRYGEQDPATVEIELLEAAGTVAGLYAAVTPDQQSRRGLRSNGSEFTVLTLAQYHLHDVVHHVHDIGLGDRLPGGGP